MKLHTLSKFGAFLGIFCLLPTVVLAQQEEQDEAEAGDDVPVQAPAQAVQPVVEEVVVTGSRLRRDTFSSVSPLQVITGEVSREAGLLDAADILQESTAATGAQIDLTFSGFVLDDGPGTSTVNLRGLAASRTLVLVNGRRVAPAGVEGAPISPNLNLLPSSLIQQYDLLLDGASSIYGSDAVAGVVNAILRKDFDGFELESFSEVPYHGAGVDHTVSLTWGRNFDRGFVGAAFEVVESEAVTLADRPWTADCTKNAEIDQRGQIRTRDLWYSTNLGMDWNECAFGSLAGRTVVPARAGSVYYTPGYSNGGWPNFSEANSVFGTFGVDGDGDGATDVTYNDYDINGRDTFAHLYPEVSQQSLFAYGEYTLEGEMNVTPYFEFLWGAQDFFSDGGAGQLFPEVPANNPYNICNPAAEGGVDCGLAQDALLTNPNYVASFSDVFAGFCASRGVPAQFCTPATFGLLNGPLGPQSTTPIVSVRGDRTLIYVDTEQYRIVGGITADMPALNFGSVRNWSFELGLSFSKSDATSSRPGIREDRLELSLGAYSSTNTPCENDLGVEVAADVAPGCVPVNMYAPSLYPLGTVIGDFATPAERNYLFDTRDFRTQYEQSLVTYFMSGDLFELPGGTAAAGVGLEYRKDAIASIPDNVARDGLFFGFFADGGAEGEKVTQEFFAEVEFPLVASAPAAEELSLNLSARLTDDEFYGQAWTEAAKMAWRPVSSLLVRATYGTSYRAPNLRELFLRDQTGFLNLFDPCYIPDIAWDELEDTYIPENDTREPYILENCRANGVDPTLAWNGGFNTFSTEVSAGGAVGLDEETSESTTFGFSWDQPLTTAFDLAIGATWYEIDIQDTIIEPSAQFIINDCYYSETGVSPFCTRIARNLSDPTNPRFDIIDRAFINRDLETVKGMDLNLTFADTWTIADRAFDVSLDLTAHRLGERSTRELDDDGNVDFSEFQGEWYFPRDTARMQARITHDRWRLIWTTNFIDGQESDPAFQDDWDDIGGQSDTCLGWPDDFQCKDIDWVDNYRQHAVTLVYEPPSGVWSARIGARNIFDQEPPFVNEGPATSSNVPLGIGYSINGRVYTANFYYTFGGGL